VYLWNYAVDLPLSVSRTAGYDSVVPARMLPDNAVWFSESPSYLHPPASHPGPDLEYIAHVVPQ
jgi:hypothetical protein